MDVMPRTIDTAPTIAVDARLSLAAPAGTARPHRSIRVVPSVRRPSARTQHKGVTPHS